jgi:hypothetical protein
VRIGIDLDNTIIDYTHVFHQVAVDLGWIPETVGSSKQEVKGYFHHLGLYDRWTELQGKVYGEFLTRAKPYPLAVQALGALSSRHQLFIVSHKTRYPIIGEQVDFHQAAMAWLETHKIVKQVNAPIRAEQVFFEETKQAKARQIGHLQCDLFIDDLPEIFALSEFPKHTKQLWFNPHQLHDKFDYPQLRSWHLADIEQYLYASH